MSHGTDPALRPRTAGPRTPGSSASAATGRPGSSPTPRSARRIDSSDEWIRERSGIVTRHAAAADETVVDMAVAAAEKALANAGITADQIGCVIVATVTHLLQTPSAAAVAGLPPRRDQGGGASTSRRPAPASATALALANDMVRGGSAEYVLVVGVEKLTDMIDPYDRGTAFLFGDGAGAAVIGPSAHPASARSCGAPTAAQCDAITQDASWTTLRDDPTTSSRRCR